MATPITTALARIASFDDEGGTLLQPIPFGLRIRMALGSDLELIDVTPDYVAREGLEIKYQRTVGSPTTATFTLSIEYGSFYEIPAYRHVLIDAPDYPDVDGRYPRIFEGYTIHPVSTHPGDEREIRVECVDYGVVFQKFGKPVGVQWPPGDGTPVIDTSVAASLTAGVGVVVTPDKMTNLYVGKRTWAQNSDGSNRERIYISAVTATTFTAVFTSNKSSYQTTVHKALHRTGLQEITPASMTGITVGSLLDCIQYDGKREETVVVTAVTASTFTAVFSQIKKHDWTVKNHWQLIGGISDKELLADGWKQEVDGGGVLHVRLGGDAVDHLYVVSGGTYPTALTTMPVTFSGGGGTGATGHVDLTAGVITSATVDSGGSGYTIPPSASLPGYLADMRSLLDYFFNDQGITVDKGGVEEVIVSLPHMKFAAPMSHADMFNLIMQENQDLTKDPAWFASHLQDSVDHLGPHTPVLHWYDAKDATKETQRQIIWGVVTNPDEEANMEVSYSRAVDGQPFFNACCATGANFSYGEYIDTDSVSNPDAPNYKGRAIWGPTITDQTLLTNDDCDHAAYNAVLKANADKLNITLDTPVLLDWRIFYSPMLIAVDLGYEPGLPALLKIDAMTFKWVNDRPQFHFELGDRWRRLGDVPVFRNSSKVPLSTVTTDPYGGIQDVAPPVIKSPSYGDTTPITPDTMGYPMDATSGAQTVNLPPADEHPGLLVWVKKMDAGPNTVTILPYRVAPKLDTISGPTDGQTSLVLATQGETVSLQSGGDPAQLGKGGVWYNLSVPAQASLPPSYSSGVVVDHFERDDTTAGIGIADTGQTWVDAAGTSGISGHQAYFPSAGISYVDALMPDASAGVTFAAQGTSQRLWARLADVGGNWDGVCVEDTGTGYSLRKRVGGVFTDLAVYTVTPGDGDLIGLNVAADQVTASLNGIPQAAVTDSTNLSATLYGVEGGDTSQRFDDFSVTVPTAFGGSGLFNPHDIETDPLQGTTNDAVTIFRESFTRSDLITTLRVILETLPYESANVPLLLRSGGHLQLAAEGDEYGDAYLELLNRTGANGARFTTTGPALVDFIFAHDGGGANLRLEGRAEDTFLGVADEWQYGGPGDPHSVLGNSGLGSRHGFIMMRTLNTATAPTGTVPTDQTAVRVNSDTDALERWDAVGTAWTPFTASAGTTRFALIFSIYAAAGGVLAAGDGFDIPVPRDCTIEKWMVEGDVSGTVGVDLLLLSDTAWAADTAYATSITGSELPTLSSARRAQNTTLTGWTTALSEDDHLRAVVLASPTPATVTSVTLTLMVTG